MKSTHNKESRKMYLGKKTSEGYEYAAKVDFGQDISTQISKVIKEKEINETIKDKVKELKELTRKFTRKEKDIQYYYKIGKKLSFLDSNSFKGVARYSVFRRIAEELQEILPEIKNEKVAIKHLDFMYGIGHLNKNLLSKGNWDQWYEIMKFKNMFKKRKLLGQILDECKSGIAGPSLRDKIKDLLK
jgi:thiamine kinase-like enzyme